MTMRPRKCPRFRAAGQKAEFQEKQWVAVYVQRTTSLLGAAGNVPVVPANVPGFVPVVSGGRP